MSLVLFLLFVCSRTVHGSAHDRWFAILHRALGCKSTLSELWPFPFLGAGAEIIAVHRGIHACVHGGDGDCGGGVHAWPQHKLAVK